ncbi:hypothetical protein B9Z65_4754 [Elsinoe australis]|uniref:Uncharacterized protein n=1 Tax=Elsinoe australis TaxID=40998 RepID=A0A2P8A5Y8_9PEZI|nr:hypothetical protein B9Z65_4754 [Elsinoe australis]
MHGNQGDLPPNLADILSTLSRFAPPVHSSGVSHTNEHAQYDPVSSLVNTLEHPQDRSAASLRPQQPIAPIVDPATITEWSVGLRCVTKVAFQNPNFANAIRNMISNQRKNEIDWYSKRQELKREQAQKGNGLSELNFIMKSIGATSSQQAQQPRSEEELQTELDAFDAKIHRAQIQMTAAMTKELKGLGVPFFGTDPSLIVSDKNDALSSSERARRITTGEFRALQRRMISYLEDMYKE